MKLKPALLISAVTLGLLATWADAAEDKWQLPRETTRFKPGPGAQIATGQCLLCHSSDYVSTQPPMDRAAWTASVHKMRDKYGAPIQEAQIEPLVDYLVKTYGTEKKK